MFHTSVILIVCLQLYKTYADKRNSVGSKAAQSNRRSYYCIDAYIMSNDACNSI